MLTRKKNPQAKPRKWNCFYCFKLGKVSSVTAHRMKRCLVCRWLRVATKRLGKTFLVTNMLRFQPAITLDLSDSSWKPSHDKCYTSSNGSLNTNIEKLTTEMLKKVSKSPSQQVCFKLGKL